MFFNPFSAKDVLIDFTLSSARRFYSSKGNPLALKGLKKTCCICLSINKMICNRGLIALNRVSFFEFGP